MRNGLGIGISAISLAVTLPHVDVPDLPTTPLLRPGATWSGSSNSGGAAPAESAVPRGTLVPDEKFIGGFSVVPGSWIHGAGVKLTAIGLPPQDPMTETINYFEECEFFLEGNSVKVTDWSVNDTPVLMPDGTMAPQGSIGFSVEIGAGQGTVKAGEATLYAYLRGQHGLERRLSIALVINVDRSLDPVAIDFTAAPTGTAATLTAPWAGADGTYPVHFSSATTRVSRSINLQNGSTAATWTGGNAPASASTRAWLNRPKLFVDPVNGNDGNIGNKPGAGSAWKSLLKAASSVPSGALVEMANGTYVEDSNSATGNAQLRMVEFRPSSTWHSADDILITRSTRLVGATLSWQIRMQLAHFFGVTVDLSKIGVIYGGVAPCTTAFSACKFLDTDANGPIDANGYDIGYALLYDGNSVIFQVANGARSYVTESWYRTYHFSGAFLYRNVTPVPGDTASCSAEIFATQGGTLETDQYDNVVVDGLKAITTREFRQRYHTETDVTVSATPTFSGGVSTITFTTSGTCSTAAAQYDRALQVTSGSLKGTTFATAGTGLNGTTMQVQVAGDARALAAGDKIRIYITWHLDALQQQGANSLATSRGIRNLVYFRVDWISPTAQHFLIQGAAPFAGTPTVQTSGTDGRDITFSTAQTWRDGDVVRLTAGPQAGEARFMDGDGSASQFGRLKSAFSTPQGTPRTAVRGKTMDGAAIALVNGRKTGTTDEFGQFQNGHKNIVIAHCTLLGRRANDLNSVGFRNAAGGAHGHRNHKQLFNVYGGVQVDTGMLPPPSEGLRLQRCQFINGPDYTQGDGKAGGTADLVTGAVGPNFLTIGVDPLVPYTIDGRRVTATAPVGCGL